jgi:hypothetical protein
MQSTLAEITYQVCVLELRTQSKQLGVFFFVGWYVHFIMLHSVLSAFILKELTFTVFWIWLFERDLLYY